MDPNVSQQNTEVMPQGNKPPVDINKTPKRPRNWKKLALWMVGIVILALLAAGTYWWLNRSQTPGVAVKNDIPLIRYQLESGPLNSFYPAAELSVSELHVNEQIFEGLVRFDNGTNIVPLLAQSWTNPDESTWIFDLKPNVKFHNGSNLTATDVKYSLEELKDSPFGNIFNSTIESVEAVTESQVRIKTSGPDPILLNKLAFLFIVDDEGTAEDLTQNGTGPYVLKSGTSPTEKSLNLVAHEEYHGGHVYTKELDIAVVEEESDRLSALQNGEVDIAPFTASNNVLALQGAGFNSLEVEDVSVWSLIINHTKTGPLQKLAVRQALYHAIDIDKLISASETNGEPVSQFILPEIAGHDPSVERLEYNTERAEQLLSEAGHSNGLSLSLDYFAARKNVAEELAKQLAEVGITLKLNEHQNSSDLIGSLLGGNADLVYIAPGSDVLDGSDISSQVLQNPNYSNKEIDELIKKIATTFDSAQRLELLQEVSRKAAEDVAVIPLFHSNTVYMYNRPYNIELDVLGYLGVYFWEVYATE